MTNNEKAWEAGENERTIEDEQTIEDERTIEWTQRQGLDRALPNHRASRRGAQGALVPDRRRGGLLRRERARRVRPAALPERPTEIFLYALDLLELDGQDLGREPLETRKATLASLLRGCRRGAAARRTPRARRRCRLPPRLPARLRGHRAEAPGLAVCQRPHWLKFKNPAAPAVKREAEEEWGKRRWK